MTFFSLGKTMARQKDQAVFLDVSPPLEEGDALLLEGTTDAILLEGTVDKLLLEA